MITSEEENIIFQSTYKETTRSKSSKVHGHGYLAKYPTRSQLLNDKLEEQARAAAATQHKNDVLEEQLEIVNEKLANEKAERERDKEESMRQMQEMRQEFQSMVAQQIQAALHQVKNNEYFLNLHGFVHHM